MKILITNYHLDEYAGSELYTYDLARILRSRGHDVSVFSLLLGKVTKKIMASGIRVVDDLEQVENFKFDILHCQHNVCAVLARMFFPSTPMVFLSHGILPELEQPPSINLDIAKYIVVSEEVRDHFIQKYSINSDAVEVVRNFVDIERFKPQTPISLKLKNVLVISNHYHKEHEDIILEACRQLDLHLEIIGQKTKPVWDVENHINKSDLVISLGRGALQGMACNREVIVFDYNGSDGLIRKENYFEIRKNNFSGRRFCYSYSTDQLIEEMKKYNPDLANKNRDLILQSHNLIDASDKFIAIYSDCCGKRTSVDLKLPRRELIFLSRSISDQLKSKEFLKVQNYNLQQLVREILDSPSWKIASTIHRFKVMLIGQKIKRKKDINGEIEVSTGKAAIRQVYKPNEHEGKKRILIISHDYIDEKMAGPGIRCFEMAKNLASCQKFEVTLAIPNESSLKIKDVDIVKYDVGYPPSDMKYFDIFISQQFGIKQLLYALWKNKIMILDLYDPLPIEHLESVNLDNPSLKEIDYKRLINKINLSIKICNLILCASGKQKDYWLGFLSSLNRISFNLYKTNPDLRNLIVEVPFGIPNTQVKQDKQVLKGIWPGINKNDKIIVWAGGIWDWFDPLTIIRAIKEISKKRNDIKLFFLGINRPNPNIPKMKMADNAIELSKELGLFNKYVFFNEDWVPYGDRKNYLLESDIGISLHYKNLETDFSFRTRILDYLWVELPIIATKGDYFADLINNKKLGVVVDYRNANQVVEAVNTLLFDERFYKETKENISKIRNNFFWENTLKPLKSFINDISIVSKKSLFTKLNITYQLLKLFLYTRYIQFKIK